MVGLLLDLAPLEPNAAKVKVLALVLMVLVLGGAGLILLVVLGARMLRGRGSAGGDLRAGKLLGGGSLPAEDDWSRKPLDDAGLDEPAEEGGEPKAAAGRGNAGSGDEEGPK